MSWFPFMENISLKPKSSHLPELSAPPSGDPLEYMVANLPSSINLNHPFEPFDSSKAAASDQM